MLYTLITRLAGTIKRTVRTANILARISVCRTVVLGRHLHRCLEQDCEGETILYNSCGERNCPQCSGGARAAWVDRTAAVLLPGVEYYQIVFTVPDGLSDLILTNSSKLYNALMRSVWKTLSEFLKRHDLQPAAVLVLHTWNQRLKHHPHIHCLVPVGSPSLDGTRWVTFNPFGDGNHQATQADSHLSPLAARDSILAELNFQLGQRFRTIFVKNILALMKKGELKIPSTLAQYQTADELKAWLDTVSPQWFRVFLQPPPVKETLLHTSGLTLQTSQTSSPSALVKYLARYLGGGPISEKRLIKIEPVNGVDHVFFYARPEKRDQPSGHHVEPLNERGQVIVSLPVIEFVQRWSIHIWPKGHVGVRHYGKFGNRSKAAYLALCRKILGLPELARQGFDSAGNEPAPSDRQLGIDHCDGQLGIDHCDSRDSQFQLGIDQCDSGDSQLNTDQSDGQLSSDQSTNQLGGQEDRVEARSVDQFANEPSLENPLGGSQDSAPEELREELQENLEPPVPREGGPQDCPRCGKEMSYLSGEKKTPWPEVFSGPGCPDWYQRTYIKPDEWDAFRHKLPNIKPKLAKPELAKPELAKPELAKPELAKPIADQTSLNSPALNRTSSKLSKPRQLELPLKLELQANCRDP